jgi:hypothetical protein
MLVGCRAAVSYFNAVHELAVARTLCPESYRIPLYRIGTALSESLATQQQAIQAFFALLCVLIAVEKFG